MEKTTSNELRQIIEPQAWAKSRLRCLECGERLYYTQVVESSLDRLVLFGESLRSLIMSRHRESGHYVGTAKELEDNASPIPIV